MRMHLLDYIGHALQIKNRNVSLKMNTGLTDLEDPVNLLGHTRETITQGKESYNINSMYVNTNTTINTATTKHWPPGMMLLSMTGSRRLVQMA